MLSSTSAQEDLSSDSPSLDQFRKACVLAFYEFHQFPGYQAWMRIGRLTRAAYWIGLDHLDDCRTRYPDWRALSQNDIEDWRLVWWCVYRLDSYANLPVAMPYLIDERLVCTSMVRDQEGQRPNQAIYLPSQPDDLWKLLPDILADSDQASVFNIHIVTETALRHVGRAVGRYMRAPRGSTTSTLVDLERALSALRLALPMNYVHPMRTALMNETRSVHHARLVTLLHMLVARLLISLAGCSRQSKEHDWMLSWQQVLESCQDIASVSEQWNSAFTLSVDPAISFIIFTALVFLFLHKKFSTGSSFSFHSNLQHCETVLLLQLEQFAKVWTLPRLLICGSCLISLTSSKLS